MATLNDTIKIAGSGENETSYSDYDYVFGSPENPSSDYAVGSGFSESYDSDYAVGSGFSEGLAEEDTSRVLSSTTGSYATGGMQSGGSEFYGLDVPYSAPETPTSALSGGIGKTGATVTPYATVTQRATVFPKGMTWPTFSGPTWDEQAIRAKARKLTAPVTAELGAKVQQAMSRYYENPNVRRMVLRDTLAGYGIGLARAIASGESAARAEYGEEYSRQYNEAMNIYATALQKLMAESTQVSTSFSVYSAKQYEEATGLTAPKQKYNY